MAIGASDAAAITNRHAATAIMSTQQATYSPAVPSTYTAPRIFASQHLINKTMLTGRSSCVPLSVWHAIYGLSPITRSNHQPAKVSLFAGEELVVSLVTDEKRSMVCFKQNPRPRQ